MQVTVNGRAMAVPDGTTVRQLLDRAGADAGRVAVERNQDVVPRKTWESVALTDGDRIEIVTFVGGG
jgi:thiamine biosynthesis protein ThiS